MRHLRQTLRYFVVKLNTTLQTGTQKIIVTLQFYTAAHAPKLILNGQCAVNFMSDARFSVVEYESKQSEPADSERSLQAY